MGSPVFNVEAERTVLGAVLVDNQAFNSAAHILRRDDFYVGANKLIFDAMATLANEGRSIDLVILKEELVRTGTIKAAGGGEYLSALLDGLPRITSVDQWARIIKQKSAVRNLRQAAATINALCDETEDPAVLIDSALNEVLMVAQGAQIGGGFHSPAETADAAVRRLESLTQKHMVGIPTGIRDYDEMTNGARAPQLIVFAGRPGTGKSAAALTIANAAASAGHVVGIVSLEMDHDELGARWLSMRSGVDAESLKYNESGWAQVAKAAGEMPSLPIYIDDDPYLTITQIMARSRRLKAEHGLDLLIIDYLQLITGDSKKRFVNRQEEIANIARALKNLAKDLGVPVIALSQLSRDVEKREKKRPILSDLRESGEIEQAADVVVFLHRDHIYDATADPSQAEWIVAKQRNGRTGTIAVRFDRGLTVFTDPKIGKEIAA